MGKFGTESSHNSYRRLLAQWIRLGLSSPYTNNAEIHAAVAALRNEIVDRLYESYAAACCGETLAAAHFSSFTCRFRNRT